MKMLFATAALCAFAMLAGCTSDGRALDKPASAPTPERAASDAAKEMAAAMAANPEAISPDAADLARLMAEMAEAFAHQGTPSSMDIPMAAPDVDAIQQNGIKPAHDLKKGHAAKASR